MALSNSSDHLNSDGAMVVVVPTSLYLKLSMMIDDAEDSGFFVPKTLMVMVCFFASSVAEVHRRACFCVLAEYESQYPLPASAH